MSTYGIVAPLDFSNNSNPGWHFITAGLRYILSRYRPQDKPIFFNMLEPDQNWNLSIHCDQIFIAGNPRLATGIQDPLFYWESGLFDLLWYWQQSYGFDVFDCWAGAGGSGPLVYGNYERNKIPLLHIKSCRGVIARDRVIKSYIEEKLSTPVIKLPCCSYFARQYYSTKEYGRREYNLIFYRPEITNPQTIGRLYQLMSGQIPSKNSKFRKPTKIIAVNRDDYEYLLESRYFVEFVNDPASLLDLIAGADCVLSNRIHISIPALSLGCRVCHVSHDIRSTTIEEFRPVQPVNTLEKAIEMDELRFGGIKSEEFLHVAPSLVDRAITFFDSHKGA